MTDVEYIAASQPNNLLSEYLFAKKALEIVDKHLPILVELYEFIHRELSYRITKDSAGKLTIHGMFNQLKNNRELKRHFSREVTKHLKEMIEIYFSKIYDQPKVCATWY